MSDQVYSSQVDATSTQKTESFVPKRSILKSSLSQNIDAQPDASLSLVQTQSQQTATVADEELTSNSQVLDRLNRRVSFAPDVTLHSFDFVVSSTQNAPSKLINANPVNQPLPNSLDKKEDDSGSMELTGPIQMTPVRPNNTILSGQIHEEYEEMTPDPIQREEKMSPIPLTVNMDDFDSRNDSAMELTGTFNQNNDKSENTIQFTKIPFTADDNNVVTSNQDMDLTEIRNDNHNVKGTIPLTKNQEDNDMDFTEVKITLPKERTSKKNLLPLNNKYGSATENHNNYEENEEEMEFTQIKKQPNKMFVNDEETGMDFTKIHNNTVSTKDDISNHMNRHSIDYKPTEETGMDFTQINKIPTVNEESDYENEMDLTNIQQSVQTSATGKSHSNNEDDSMEFTNVISQPISSNEKPDSKRTRVIYDKAELQSNVKIPRTRTTTISEAERMSPIKLDELNDHPIFQGSKTYSLGKFLEDIQSDFLQEIEDLKVPLNPISIPFKEQHHLSDANDKLQLLISLYSDIPWLQMVTFMSKELIMMNDKSQHVFDDLQTQIAASHSPPLLFKHYYSVTDIEKEKINEQLYVVKQYSYLEAKKTWYKWQLSNLDNIKIILNENLSILQARKINIDKKLSQQQKLNSEMIALKESIKQDVITFKNSVNINLKEVSLDNKIKLAKLKRYLEVQKANINELPTLKRNRNQLISDARKLKQALISLQGRYQDVDKNLLTKYRSSHLIIKDKLKSLENITGIHFKSFSNNLICFQMPLLSSDLILEFNLNATCGDFMTYTLNSIQDTFTNLLFADHFKKNYNPKTPIREVIAILLTSIRNILPVIRQFKLLQRIFVTHIRQVAGSEHEYLIELKQANFISGHSVIYQIPLLSFKSFMDGSKDNLVVHASIPNGQVEADTNELVIFFTSKTRHIIPPLNKKHVTVIDGTISSSRLQ